MENTEGYLLELTSENFKRFEHAFLQNSTDTLEEILHSLESLKTHNKNAIYYSQFLDMLNSSFKFHGVITLTFAEMLNNMEFHYIAVPTITLPTIAYFNSQYWITTIARLQVEVLNYLKETNG